MTAIAILLESFDQGVRPLKSISARRQLFRIGQVGHKVRYRDQHHKPAALRVRGRLEGV